MELPRRPYAAAGVATAAASLIAVTPVAHSSLASLAPAVQLLAGEEEIVLDLVRHGSNGPPSYLSTIGSFLPGYSLNATGEEQAQAVAQVLAPGTPYAGIYAGDNIRMPETAAPLADLLDMKVQLLPGLDEIPGGIYNGLQASSPGGILYELTLAAWAFGLDFVPMPGSYDINGVAFDENFTGAVQTIYDNTVSTDAPPKDVLFSGEAAISTWVLMNAKNPDLSIFLPMFLEDLVSGKAFLPNTGIVVVQGDPEAGWTIVSWNGQSIPAPGLPTELVVDVRDLITAPQFAAYNIFEAALSGDPTTILNAIQTGASDIGTALVQFPVSVISDLLGAVSGGTQNLAGDITGLLQADVGAATAATLLDPAGISSLLGTFAADLPAMLGLF
ncbi:histidine phosphatase family protein [Mycobacterium botniense]|uniref:Histidine phosphatase family protein n=1 Tax=Mycobacterium botniense TaxID=84962 RepID=A0A7I9Y3F7_9MYCO|nr:histidine phosphatase family protein [Mycobacterium botniense]GFG76598.1 hypothetical protein MBOT_39630 [Mycobacterium botniense]